jgi:SAM-dependent methyltransferase
MNCDPTNRYVNEQAFSDASASKTLSRIRADLKVEEIDSFEGLSEKVDYLRSVPAFYGNLRGRNLLEMGCGNGWLSRRFAKSGANVWACDISPGMIDIGGRLAQAAGLDIVFETKICEELDYPEGFFDFLFMHMALHHCDVPATARQMHRVLKPEGKAVVVDDYAYHPIMRLYRKITPNRHTKHEHPLTESDVSIFCSTFRSCEVEYSGITNLFETSRNRFAIAIKPYLRKVDSMLCSCFTPIRKFSRIIILKATK